MTYNYQTGELSGEAVCRYCGALERITPYLCREPATFHLEARCVEDDEPCR